MSTATCPCRNRQFGHDKHIGQRRRPCRRPLRRVAGWEGAEDCEGLDSSHPMTVAIECCDISIEYADFTHYDDQHEEYGY